jgi:hypothetical protein
MKRAFFFSFLCIVTVGYKKNSFAQNSENTISSRSFVIYNQIHYLHTPTDLSADGLSSSIIHYPKSFLDSIPNDPKRTGNPNSDSKVINADKLIALAKDDATKSAKNIVILDIEAWSYSASAMSQTLADFKKVINIYRTNNPGAILGFYGAFPQTKWSWSGIATDTQYKQWQAVNDQLAPIVPLIDYFAPDLYRYSTASTLLEWKQYAQANLNEIKRYNSKAHAYAFLMPQIKGGFIPYDDWKFQLDELYNMGYDGVIIWTDYKGIDGKGLEFNAAKQLGWWGATIDFIKEKRK